MMAAFSEVFPWSNSYGHHKFFEQRMQGHGRVHSYSGKGQGVYELTRDSEVLRVFICDCYAFGVAEYMEAVGHLGRLDAVVINSNWCGYSDEVKLHCKAESVGVFTIAEFMGALNRPDYWNYLSEAQAKTYKKRGLA